MDNKNCGSCEKTCSECGRPWTICKESGGCAKCGGVKFCEYGRSATGCIRQTQPGCPKQAVIPSVTVESAKDIVGLSDCLVHIADANTTMYIDDKCRPIITWAGPVNIPGYDMEANPNNYRDQIVTDVENQIAVIYDKSGHGYMFGLAENIDLQDEVNNKIDEMAEDGTLEEIVADYLNANAVWGFDTVSDMQASTNIVEGSFARTLGFYTLNDGGGALYKIRNVTNDDTIDGKFLLEISDSGNQLVAELIVDEERLDIRKIGAKTDTDIHDYVLAVINRNIDCYIPAGVWKTTPLQIAKYDSARIFGEPIYGNNNANGTIVTPVANQEYILKVGYDNTTSIANDITIEGIQFNTGEYTVTNAVLFSRVQFGKFDELCFRACKCTDCAFRIRETWETDFGRIMFRIIDAPKALIFGNKIGAGNISTNYFKFLSFEGCRYGCIKFEPDCAYSMNTIDVLDFESGTATFGNEIRQSITSVESYTPLSVIETGNGYGEININNIHLNAIAQHVYVDSVAETARAYDRVIECTATDTGYFNYSIGNLTGVGNTNKPILINGGNLDKFICNNFNFRAGLDFVVNINACRMYKYGDSTFANNFTQANLGRAYRDLKVINNIPECKGTSHAVRVATLITQGNKLYVHAKGNGNVNYGGSDHVTLSNVSEYQWFAIDMVASAFTSQNNLLLGTNSTVEIDSYFFATESA